MCKVYKVQLTWVREMQKRFLVKQEWNNYNAWFHHFNSGQTFQSIVVMNSIKHEILHTPGNIQWPGYWANVKLYKPTINQGGQAIVKCDALLLWFCDFPSNCRACHRTENKGSDFYLRYLLAPLIHLRMEKIRRNRNPL